jgi:molybdate transport system regulatory protein
MSRLAIRLHIGPHRLGPGKIALLEAIDRTGSLSQAARDLEMSYRRAWVLVAETNAMFVEAAVATAHGGSAGGGATVTPFGRSLIAAYRRMEAQALTAASTELAFLEGAARHEE